MARKNLPLSAAKYLQRGDAPPPAEDDVQSQIVQWLRANGYLVQVTTRRVKKCRQCGAWPRKGDGATRGIADLLVRHPAWPNGIWLAIEVKRPGTVRWSSPEQKQLAIVGDIVVVQSIEDAARELFKKESECLKSR